MQTDAIQLAQMHKLWTLATKEYQGEEESPIKTIVQWNTLITFASLFMSCIE